MKVPSFSELRVAVVGDLVADHYIFAEPRRLSREAPVMVLRHSGENIGAGGAANVARNLRALDAQVSVFGAIGRDMHGRELNLKLEEEGLDLTGVVSDPDWVTPTKTRILAAEARRFPQQILRIDRESDEPVSTGTQTNVANQLLARMDNLDALVVSDYAYGLIGEQLAGVARAFAVAGKTVVLDPRKQLDRFEGISAVTPNVGELAQFTGRAPEDLDDVVELRKAADTFLKRMQSRYLLVTRGNLGMALFGGEIGFEGIAVQASGDSEVTDVSGAGDSAASVFALALAAGESPTSAMVLANTASGVVVMENGTAVCTRIQLEEALRSSPAPTRLERAEFE
jgi:D-glycero-beta-D-manno-heptose-7-phosphate kinase